MGRRPEKYPLTEVDTFRPEILLWIRALLCLMSRGEQQDTTGVGIVQRFDNGNPQVVKNKEMIEEFFDGISQVIVATRSSSKSEAVKALVTELMIYWGQKLISVKKIDVPGNEPEWDQVFKIAIDKVEKVLAEALPGKNGGGTVVFAADVMTKVDQIIRTNLSRTNPDEQKKYLPKYIEDQVKTYSKDGGTTVEIDVGCAISGKKRHGESHTGYVKAMSGVRIIIEIDSIPEPVLRGYLQSVDPRKVINVGAGVPIFDMSSVVLRYIKSIRIYDLKKYADNNGHIYVPFGTNGDTPMHEINDFQNKPEQDREFALNLCRGAVIGAIAPTINHLMQQVFVRDPKTPWRMC